MTRYTLHERSSRRTLALSLQNEKTEKEHIEKLNQAKLRFFTNVSHEFRTPLTLIISQIEQMIQNERVPSSLHNSIFRIKKHTQQMKQLIDELLDFRKFDQHYIQLKLSERSLNHFLEEIYLSFSAFADQKQIIYRLQLLPNDIVIWMDDWQLRKVFFNLLSNAFKHTPDKGTITLVASLVAEEVHISVKDSGTGISQEDIKRIFDRYYQVDNQKSIGTGIGLALTKSIVLMHHGKIEVESSLKQGSCFTIALPTDRRCYEKDIEVTFIQNANPASLKDNLPVSDFAENIELQDADKKYKVLLIEDNIELLQSLVEIFSPLYQVFTACNGEEGLEQIAKEMPDLIVSDIMMPVMTGTEMCKKIKNNLNLCHIPIVLLTALDSVEQNIEGLCWGADDYISKPFNVRVLLVRCNNLIRNRLLVQSRFAKDVVAEVDLLATNPIDKNFLERVTKIIEQHLDNDELDISMLCRELGVGRTLLHAKFKALTRMTPNEFMLNYKLKKAAQMLKNEAHLQISEISDRLGFGSPRYFTRCFKHQFNVTPAEYRKEHIAGKLQE